MTSFNPQQPDPQEDLNGLNLIEHRIKRFADGELTPTEQMAFFKMLAEQPEIIKQIQHQHQLRESISKTMAQGVLVDGVNTPIAIPAELKAKLLAMADEVDVSETETGKSSTASSSDQDDLVVADSVVAKIGGPSTGIAGAMRWFPSAIAAILLLGVLVAVMNLNISPVADTAVTLVSNQKVQALASRHETCAKNPEELYNDPNLPETLEELPPVLSSRFSQGVPALDLSAAGYTFERIGTCTIPGRDALHLIYRSTQSGDNDDGNDAVSLWIRPDEGKLQIAEEVIYFYPDSDHPLLVWRAGGMLYYLMSDNNKDAYETANALRESI